MITIKDYETNLELKNLLGICYEHPKYNEKCKVLSTKKGDVLETQGSDGNKVYFILVFLLRARLMRARKHLNQLLFVSCKRKILLVCHIYFLITGNQKQACKVLEMVR